MNAASVTPLAAFVFLERKLAMKRGKDTSRTAASATPPPAVRVLRTGPIILTLSLTFGCDAETVLAEPEYVGPCW